MGAARRLLAKVLVPVEDDRGAVATEYGLTLLLITLAIVVAATLFGLSVSDLYDDAGTSFPSSP